MCGIVGFRAWGLGWVFCARVWGFGFRFRALAEGFRAQGSGGRGLSFKALMPMVAGDPLF